MNEVKIVTKVAGETPVNEGQSNIERMLMLAVEQKLPIETLEKLLAMRKELKAEAALEAFNEALAAFQAECPVIDKDKHVLFNTKSGEKVNYHYAPIDSIIRQVQGLLGKHGLSYKFKLEETPKGIKAICILTHKLGHCETSDFTADMAGTSLMSSAQVSSSKATFAKRNAFCNVTGIVTGDDDIDAQKDKTEDKLKNGATVEQYATIDQLIVKAGVTKADVVQKTRTHYAVSFTDITRVQADGLIEMLRVKIKSMEAQSAA